jgi:hypothetical protein
MDEPIDISVINRLNNSPIATGMEIFFHRGDGQFLVNKLKADSRADLVQRSLKLIQREKNRLSR